MKDCHIMELPFLPLTKHPVAQVFIIKCRVRMQLGIFIENSGF